MVNIVRPTMVKATNFSSFWEKLWFTNIIFAEGAKMFNQSFRFGLAPEW
jgi:hypothetical protein